MFWPKEYLSHVTWFNNCWFFIILITFFNKLNFKDNDNIFAYKEINDYCIISALFLLFVAKVFSITRARSRYKWPRTRLKVKKGYKRAKVKNWFFVPLSFWVLNEFNKYDIFVTMKSLWLYDNSLTGWTFRLNYA